MIAMINETHEKPISNPNEDNIIEIIKVTIVGFNIEFKLTLSKKPLLESLDWTISLVFSPVNTLEPHSGQKVVPASKINPQLGHDLFISGCFCSTLAPQVG